MVDRTARDAMADEIERYLNEEIAQQELDRSLRGIVAVSSDETLKVVQDHIWQYDSDNGEHLVAGKDEWDFFQRLLLVLRSEGRIEVTNHRPCQTARQSVALCSLGVYFCVLLGGDLWESWHLVAIPFGGVSVFLFIWGLRDAEPHDSNTLGPLWPFASLTEILAVRRAVPSFVKRRFKEVPYTTSIGEILATPLVCLYGALLLVLAAVAWLMLSPVVLLCQALPKDWSTSRVVLR